MRDARKFFITILLATLTVSLTTALHSQSLAELARKERARKTPEGTAKVYTNEDIPSTTPSPAAPAPAQAQEPQAQKPAPATAQAGATEKAEAKPAEASEKSTADLEKGYREKFAQLRDKVAFEEQKLDVMQRELNLMMTQFYSDPNVALREQNSRVEINKRTQDIETQKQVVEKAKQAIADLEDELRKKGLPPGWAR